MSTKKNDGYHRAIEVKIPKNLDNIRVVLFEPQGPINIGSIARAIKGMGISDLSLVNPKPFLDQPETWYMAHGAIDILQNCRIIETLDQALHGVNFLVGTTHRRRRDKLISPITAKSAAEQIARHSQDQKVGLLFGSEDSGLSTDQLSRCHQIASIPMATKNPSLNLAQAVQIFVYEIFSASIGEIEPIKLNLAEIDQIEQFYDRLLNFVKKIGVQPRNGNWRDLMLAIRRVFSRTQLETRDIKTIELIFSTANRYIERLRMKNEELKPQMNTNSQKPKANSK